MSESEFINDFYQGDDYRKFRLLQKIYRENKGLKEKNEFLMKRDNKCQMLEQVISNIKNFIEELYDNTDDTTCYDIDINTKQDILDILKEVD